MAWFTGCGCQCTGKPGPAFEPDPFALFFALNILWGAVAGIAERLLFDKLINELAVFLIGIQNRYQVSVVRSSTEVVSALAGVKKKKDVTRRAEKRKRFMETPFFRVYC